MLVRLCLLATTAASASSIHLDHDIYEGAFTSEPREDDLLHAVQTCDKEITCAGISLGKNGTIQSHTIHEHSFVGPYRTPKTHVTNKPYTYHRGQITAGDVLSVETGLTLKGAKDHCTSNPDCVAFSYPVWSLTGLNFLPDVTFVSSLDAFTPSDDDEYRTYVSNDVERASRVNGDVLPYDEEVKRRPYRACCNREEVPSMEEIEAADTMERISCNISREEFFLKYEVPRKPVMLVGCEKDWPAVTEWTYEKLIPRFSNSSKWRARFEPDSESYSRVKWEKLATAMSEDKPFYIFDQLKDVEAKSIEDDFEEPAPLAGGNLYATMNSKGIFWAGPLRWFCVGKFGSGTRSHIDPFSSDAWNTLIQGHKWWVIYPLGVNAKETFCESSCTDKNLVRPWYASVGVNAARTEYLNDQYAYHVLQKPGETIYAPDGIAHSVFNMDSTIAITRNFGSAANLDAVWQEVCTSGDDRKWKIMYNLVLNKEQRRRVRQSKYWPFSERCKAEEENEQGSKGGKNKGSDLPEEEIVDALHNEGWWPEEGDVVEARYKGKYNEWYKGTINKVSSDGEYDVLYDDGDYDKKLPRMAIRKYVDPKKGEIVKVKTFNKKRKEAWTLAVITNIREDRTVDVKQYGKQRLESVPLSHIQRFDWQFQEGSRVEAKWTNDSWFKGMVAKARRDGTYDVEFNDGDFISKIGRDSIRFLWAKVK